MAISRRSFAAPALLCSILLFAACSFDAAGAPSARPRVDDPGPAGGADADLPSDAHAGEDAQSGDAAVRDAQAPSDARAPEERFSVSGELVGLTGDGVVLDVGGHVVSAISDGAFATPPVFELGARVAIRVLVAPQHPRQLCTTAAEPIAIDGDVDGVVVSCAPLALPVSGAVSGLLGDGLVLDLNGDETLSIASDGPFAFSTALADEQPFAIEVATQPSDPAQQCTVAGGSGVAGGDGVEVDVHCSTELHAIGGNVAGLVGEGLVVSLNGELLAVAQNGAFSFDVPDGAAYVLQIAAQPTAPLQTCTVTAGGSGTADGPIDDIAVDCDVREFRVRGFARGTAGGVSLALGGEVLVVDDGPFAFVTPRADGSAYAVAVATPPTGKQCSIIGGAGQIDGGDVVVDVLCADALQLSVTTSGVRADLVWNDIGADYDLLFVEDSALDPLSGTVIADATSVHAFTRALGRTYVFVVRARLADGHAIHSAPVTIDGDFFREGFEGSTFPPPGFSTRALALNGPGDTQWARTPDRPRSGSYAAWHLYGGSMSGNQNGWLITPLLPLGDAPVLRFYENVDYAAEYVGHYIYVCTAATLNCASPPTNYSQLAELDSPAEDVYVQRTVDLAAFANQDVYLVFRYSGVFADSWFIDDIEIDLR